LEYSYLYKYETHSDPLDQAVEKAEEDMAAAESADTTVAESVTSIPPSDNTTSMSVVMVPSNPEKGFYHAYGLMIPERTTGTTRLIVEGNNDTDNISPVGFESAVEKVLQKGAAQGPYMASKINAPCLMPAFPRELEKWTALCQQLDSETLNYGTNPERSESETVPSFKRVDLQLLAMIEDARGRLTEKGIETEEKVILTGFASSAVFATRFHFLHYDRVIATLVGGVGGLIPLPVSSIQSLPDAAYEYPEKELAFPLGTNDYASLTGREFSLDDYNKVPQLYYNGMDDDFCPYRYNAEDLTHEEATVVKEVFLSGNAGFRTSPVSLELKRKLWTSTIQLLKESGANNYYSVMVGDVGPKIHYPTIDTLMEQSLPK